MNTIGQGPSLRPVGTEAPLRPQASRPERSEAAAKAPPGATLWELLTPEERAFFAEQSALGPLNYRPGPSAAKAPACPIGSRLDVKG